MKKWEKYCKNTRKNAAKEAKKCTQASREVKYAYTKKNDFSLEVNTAIQEAF